MDARRAVLLEDALEGEVEGLAGELAGEGERDLGLAGGEDQGGVDDAERLGEEGEVGTEEGELVVGVLFAEMSVLRALEERGERNAAHVEDVRDGEGREGRWLVHGGGWKVESNGDED